MWFERNLNVKLCLLFQALHAASYSVSRVKRRGTEQHLPVLFSPTFRLCLKALERSACNMEISGDIIADGGRDYLQVALALRDRLDELISGARDSSRGSQSWSQRKILVDVAQELELVLAKDHDVANKRVALQERNTSRRLSSCHHEELMNPALWSTLPKELLSQVFARLPFPYICLLMCVSKEWRKSFEDPTSEFSQALGEASPRILARVTLLGDVRFFDHIYDVKRNGWHTLCVDVDYKTINLVHMHGAADCGLVCYVYIDTKARGLVRIYVTNPMTGDYIILPYLKVLTYEKPTMLHNTVDRKTHRYKVIVVGFMQNDPVVEVYDSEVRQWTEPEQSLGCIFGYLHTWSEIFQGTGIWEPTCTGPCAYDFHEGRHYDFGDDEDVWSGLGRVQTFALENDRFFVVHDLDPLDSDSNEYSLVSEYCVREGATTSWVKVESRTRRGINKLFLCPPTLPHLTFSLHACNGFLFLFANTMLDDPYGVELGWLYNLATCEWRDLPPVEGCLPNPSDFFMTDVMCELRWNIQP